VTDNTSWAKGRHLYRFGGNVRWVFSQPYNDAGIIPLYNLGFNATGNPNPLNINTMFPGGISTEDFNNASSILALLGGMVNNATQTFNVTSRTSGFVPGATQRRDIDYHVVGLYVGDNWRASERLRLNFGLRWEYISPPTEKKGLALLPIGGVGALSDPQAVLDFFGTGTGRPLYRKDLNNFAPSFSFAWDPFGTGKTSVRGGYSVSYTIDSNVTTVQNAFNSNAGLRQAVNRVNVSGTVSGGGRVPVALPAYQVPRTIADNLRLNPNAALFAIDEDLRTPYVQQWTLGVEREIFKDTAVEVRYVGNHAVKLHRAVDRNQVRVRENGFLDDFLRAQRNLAASGNPAIGEPLRFFPGLGRGGDLANAQVLTRLREGRVGDLAAFYLTNRATYLAPAAGAQLGADVFVLNPNAFAANFISHLSFSNYHGLQTEVRRRWRNGLYFQANYTFSKALTDFEGSQTDVAAFLDNAQGYAKEKKRAAFDVTQVFNANWVYELPFGPGRRLANTSGPLGRVIGGWNLGTLWQMRSGRPISFLSGRGTVSSDAASGKNTVVSALSPGELKNLTGDFRDAQGRPSLFDPRLVGPDGRANPQFLQNPGAGQLGLLHLTPVSGPGYFNMDVSLFKRTYITESVNVEFRAEFFNVWNNVNWSVAEARNINSVNFARVTTTFDPRILQLALKLNF